MWNQMGSGRVHNAIRISAGNAPAHPARGHAQKEGDADMKKRFYKIIDTMLLITVGTAIDAMIMGTLYLIIF